MTYLPAYLPFLGYLSLYVQSIIASALSIYNIDDHKHLLPF